MTKVFLGGTCNDSNWRDRLIPKLKIDYFNPVVYDWNEEAQKEEERQKEICDILLYVITPKMKGFFSIAEVVDSSNKRAQDTIFYWNGVYGFDDSQVRSLRAVEKMINKNGARTVYDFSTLIDVLNK